MNAELKKKSVILNYNYFTFVFIYYMNLIRKRQ